MKIKNFLFCLVCVIILFSDVKKTNALSELNINDNDIDISSGQLIAEDTKYFATVTFYNKNILYSVNGGSEWATRAYTIEISENECETENLKDNYYFATGDEEVITDYKKLKTTISKKNSQFYNVKNQLDWKAGKMPKTRGIDLFGIRISDGIQPVANSKAGTVVYSMYNECLGTTEQKSINLASNGSWKFDNSGYGVAFQLPKNTTYSFYYDRYFINTWDCTTSSPKIAESSGNKSFPVTLKSLSSTMSFDVTKTYANVIMNAISAYGTYQHSVKSLTLNEALSFSIGSSGLGGVFVVSASIKNKYDNMGGTHAQLIGINW